MKAKACTRCRQSKLRCDSDTKAPDACSRCQSINEPCVFDRNFQCTSRNRRILELEVEVARLRRAAATTAVAATSTPPDLTASAQPLPSPSLTVATSACLQDKSLGNAQLAAAQVNELFRVFFIQCHIFLPISIPQSPEAVYEKCPLLFWVICGVASSTRTMLQLQPEVQGLIGQIVFNPQRSVEVVQALLLLCMWPFPFHSTLGDPSFLYCGLATQIGLQIGLHRPTLSQEFSSKREVLEVDDSVRKSTWMACYVVNQMQAGRLGVPVSMQTDYTFFRNMEARDISPVLVALCRISRPTIQFTNIIGTSAQNPSGLMEPVPRIDMVRFFSAELDNLQRTHFPEMSQVIQISFLTSRLYLWSFLLHDDIPNSQEVIEFFYQAEKDAAALIQLASEKNLSRSPFHLPRAVLYSALLLIKILRSGYASQPELISDHIHVATRALSSAVKVEDDHVQRWTRHLERLVTLEDMKRNPPIRSRMAASLMYDAIRLLKESIEVMPAGANRAIYPENVYPSDWMEVPTGPAWLDIDGINWEDLGGLL